MKRFAILLTFLIVWTNGQIIFPDQYETIRNNYANSQTLNESRFPPVSNSPPSGFGSAPISVPANVGTFYPLGSSAQPAAAQSYNNAQDLNDKNLDREAQYWSNHVNIILAKGVSRFALDMDRAIYRSLQHKQSSQTRPNVVFSPLSIASTLAMVLLGSAGVTFNEVAKILGLESGVDISSHSEIVHYMLGLVLKSIDAGPNSVGPQITIANGIFVQSGYPIRDQFKAISQLAYNNEIMNLDFMNHAAESRESINGWVKSRTHDKIESILEQPIDADTKLIIASALYFNGEWEQHFAKGATSRKPFQVSPNESVMVDMMFNAGTFPFYEDQSLGVKIVGYPYKSSKQTENTGLPPQDKVIMYVMQPTARDAEALSRLENRLTVENIGEMISQMKDEACVLGMPRMKLSSTLNLNEALQALELKSLFNPYTSNLGLLSSGLNETSSTGQPSIFTRSGGEDSEDPPNSDDRTTSAVDPAKKNNYFRYEDKRGGYRVQQWDSGVLIEKIPRSAHRKRSVDGNFEDPKTSRKSQEITRKEKETYEIPIDSNQNQTKLKFIDIDDRKYKFDRMTRSKRQARPIDSDFIQFIASRRMFPNYGIDALRNGPNLINPGLFASDVLHRVEMDVTETGTVAAAATALSFQRGGDIKRLLANRPFLFFIRHERSKLILFWGTVNKPTPNY